MKNVSSEERQTNAEERSLGSVQGYLSGSGPQKIVTVQVESCKGLENYKAFILEIKRQWPRERMTSLRSCRKAKPRS